MNKVIYITKKKRQRTQAKMDGRVINLPSVAITIASRSLPPYLRVTLALLSGATLNGSISIFFAPNFFGLNNTCCFVNVKIDKA